jgi:hypothetical protein
MTFHEYRQAVTGHDKSDAGRIYAPPVRAPGEKPQG